MSDRKMSVYVIKSAMNICKIGISFDPEQRLRNLLTSHGLGLDLVHVETVESGHAALVERAAHKMLDKVRSNGEWFRVSEEKAIHAVKVATWIVTDCHGAFIKGAKIEKKAKRPAAKRPANHQWGISRMVSKPGDPELLKEWIGHSVEKREGSEIRMGILYDAYVEDCKGKRVDQVSVSAFGRIFSELGYPKTKKGGRVWYVDLAFIERPTLKIVK